jgi:nitroimidazol reductase NimA-like FMN-containing flavoprotein (pyridoxamine 5'-phosphate oxidase superfamily)
MRARPSMGVRLTRDEAWEALAAAHTGIFTTLRHDGVPVSLPVWFVVLNDRIYLSGPATTKRVARIRRDPRCAFLVESGERWSELRAVHLTGTAHLVTDANILAEVAAALTDKYAEFRTGRAEMPDDTREHYAGETATIQITPDERILSWDNSKLDLRS